MKHLREMQNLLQAEIEAATAKQLVLRQLALFADDLDRQGFAVDVDLISSQTATTVTISVRMADGPIPSAPADDASEATSYALIEEFDAPMFAIDAHDPPDDIAAADDAIMALPDGRMGDTPIVVADNIPTTTHVPEPPAPALDDGRIAHPTPGPVAPPAASSPTRPDRFALLTPGKAPLSPQDRLTLLALHDTGQPTGQIAAALGRDPRGFYHIVAREVALRDAPPAGIISTPVAPKTIPLEEAPPFDPAAAARGAPTAFDGHLAALGNKGRWSDPADDLALVEGLGKGVKLAEVALDLGIDAGVCRQRFDLLVPAKTIAQQTGVLEALRRRVAANGSSA